MQDLQDALRRWLVGDGWADAAVIVLAAAAVYGLALWITRTGKKRFLGRNTIFDFILAFILGSTLSRAINGDAAILPTAVAGFLLVALHWLVGVATTNSRGLGQYVKGEVEAVVRDGDVDWDAMHGHHLTQNDLEEAARQSGLESADDIRDAYFERNGTLSVIPHRRVHVVDVDVEDGVQTVRIELRR